MNKLNSKKAIAAVIAACCLAAAIIAAVSLIIIRASGGGTEYAVTEYSVKVSINGTDMAAYDISGRGPYIILEDLESAGLAAEFEDDENISIYYTEKKSVKTENISGKTAKFVNKKHYINSEKKVKYLKQYTDSSKTINRMYSVKNLHLVSVYDLRSCGIIEEVSESSEKVIAMRTAEELVPKTQTAKKSSSRRADIVKPSDGEQFTSYDTDMVTIFLDPGHGKASGLMSDAEKTEYGWTTDSNGVWGEWRHWRNGKYGADCIGDDGVSQSGKCLYPIENGDRDTEPDINMQNCLAAKEQLEQMGYKVVLSRESNYENPSITKRINDAVISGAELYVCVHSNAGGGSGTAYISLNEKSDYYALHPDDEYAKQGNILGKIINDKIAEKTSLQIHGSGEIENEEYLILFHKSPITCAYLEIGFFDDENDLKILNDEYDEIGRAIAEGIDEYCAQYIN